MKEASEYRGGSRFRVIATIGPASIDLVGELASAGADSLRINASHLSPGSLRPYLMRIREQAAQVPVVVDLQGAKMRLGRFEERLLSAGDPVALALFPDPSCAADIPLPHPELFQRALAGQTLTIDDGRLKLRVTSASPHRLLARALVSGALRQRKGVNVIEHPIELDDLSESDVAFVEETRGIPNVSFAYSFMRDGREAGWLRLRLQEAQVAGKIERAEAVEALRSVAKSTDELWICRGDLGEQLGPFGLARFVSSLDPIALGIPVLMAGQVLEHLTFHPAPTRSEICHLHDIVRRGYAGIVLSDETAIGRDPLNALGQARFLVDSFMPQGSTGS